MTVFHHFAYGSNMSVPRLRARCPSATPLAVGFVRGRQLRFHKIGRDGTGKADAFYTGNPTDVVRGIIYRCQLGDKYELDRCECLGDGYEEVVVDVHLGDRVWKTFLYEAMPHRIDPEIRPAAWYQNHVHAGAREHGLPEPYQSMIAAFQTLDDFPPEECEKNLERVLKFRKRSRSDAPCPLSPANLDRFSIPSSRGRGSG